MGDKKENIHVHHRARLRKRFLDEGLDSFAEHNVLEFLLFYGIPYKDTNPIAHELIKQFGSLQGVLDASYEDLCKVPGIGEATAALIVMIPQISRRYLTCKAQEYEVFCDTDDLIKYFEPRFVGLKVEILLLMCFDNKGKLLSCNKIAQGNVKTAQIDIKKLVEVVLQNSASSVAFAHNHPQGFAVPSSDDVDFTKRVIEMLNLMSVRVHDHIIFSTDDHFSMANHTRYKELFR